MNKMSLDELSRKMGDIIESKSPVGVNALKRFISNNRHYGSFDENNFTLNKGQTLEKMTQDFMAFADKEYNRAYPSSNKNNAYSEAVKLDYANLLGPRRKPNGAYGSYGDGVAFGTNKQNPVNTAIKNNNASVGKTNKPFNPLSNMNKGMKLERGSHLYNQIKNAIGEIDGSIESTVAWFDASDIYNISESFSNSKVFHGGKKSNSNTRDYNTEKVHKEVYTNLKNANLYEDIHVNLDNLVKTQSGTDLIKNVIKYDGSHNIMTNKSSATRNLLNYDSMMKGLDKLNTIVKDGGTFTVFDIEANSGINQYGHTVLNNITELASVTYNVDPITKKATESKVFNSVLGFTEDEYKDVVATVKALGSKHKQDWSIEEKVLYDRLNIYSQSEIINTDGFERQVVKAKGIEEINTSIENALAGAKKLRDVATSQEVWMKKNNIDSSYEQVRTKYIQSFRDNLTNGLAIGHNVGTYDIPMINRMTNSAKPIEYVDTLQTSWYAQNELGRNSIYLKDKRVSRPKGVGPATQASITEAHGLKNKSAAAHIAINDVRENALLIVGELFNPQVDKNGTISISDNTYLNKIINPNMKKISDIYNKTSSKYTGMDQVYLMDFTMQKSFGTMDNALSFEYDPITNSFKSFDGFIMGRGEGEVANAGYPAFGPRKGALYQHEVFELEMNDKFKEQFLNIQGATKDQADKLFQQYSTAEKVYMVKSREYMDLDELTKKLGSKELAEHYYNNRPTTYSFETNYDRIGANLGVNVANIVDGKLVANKEVLEGLDFKVTGYNEGVKVESAPKDVDELLTKIVDKSYNRTINDSAARKVRDLDYKGVMRIRNYQNQLIKEKGITTNSPIVTRIAQMVSQNKEINLTEQAEIINALGWNDYKVGSNKIVKETINNTLAMDSYVMQMSPLIDAITEVLDETFGTLDLSSPESIKKISGDPKLKEILYKKDFAFKQLYNSYLEEAMSNPVVANSWKETLHSANELNKIDFNTYNINPNKYMNTLGGWTRNASAEVSSINLNSPNSLINLFYDGKFKDLDEIVSKDGNAGFQALTDAYNFIRNDKRFVITEGKKKTRIFDNIDINSYRGKNISQLNDDMMEELRNFASKAREINSSWGYINPRMNQDILGSSELINYIQSQGKESIKEKIQGLKSNLPKDYKILSSDNHKAAVDELVNSYFLNFNMGDMDLDGFTNQQKAYAKKQYELAKRTARSKADSLLKAISGTDIQLVMTETNNGNVLNLIQGNQVTQLHDMVKFNHRKGVMTYQVGDNEYALKMGLGRTKDSTTKKLTDSFSLTNTVEKITSGNLDHKHAEWAVGRGDSIVEAIVYNNRRTASLLRDASARIDINNGQLISQGFHFDVNEMLYALPELLKSGKIEDIEKNFDIPDKARETIRKIATNIENDPKKYASKTFTKVLPVELNFFTDHYMAPLLEAITTNPGDFTRDERNNILSGLGFDTKNTALAKGNISGIKNYLADPLAKMDNDARPPVTQMQNVRLYDKDKTDAQVDVLKKKGDIYKNLNATSVYTGDNMDKFMYKNKSNSGKIASNGLTMKYMQIDSYSLRNQFLDEKNQNKMFSYIENAFGEFSKDDKTRAKEVILDRAKRLSTYEQQSAMDARVHDINFHRSNTQTVNAKKKLIAEHKDNLEVLEYIKEGKLHFSIDKDGNIKYDLGVKVEKGQLIGIFGNEQFSQKLQAKNKGVFRGRFFDDHGNVVSEETIADFLKQNNVDLTNNEEILKSLNKTFDFKYQILGMEEMHGSKAFLGASEKTTIDSMKLAIGEIDKDLAKELKAIGEDDIIGKVVSKDYLDEFVARRIEQRYLRHEYLKENPNEKLAKEKAKNLMDRIYNERYAFSDAVHQIDVFKDVNFITNLDVTKHSSATALMHNALNKLRADGNLTEKYLDEMFGKGTYEIIGEGANAQVKFNGKLKEVKLDFEVGTVLGDALNQDTVVEGVGGKPIGHTGVGHFVSVFDDPAGTTSGVFSKVDNKGNIIKEVQGKGVKFTDAMGINLDRQTYNVDGLTGVYKHFESIGQLDEFNKVFGHALDMENFKNGQLAFNEDYAYKSMAAPITERLRNQLIKSDYSQTLAEVTDPKYDYLKQSIATSAHKNISVDRAEIMYSYNRGLEALEINAKNTKSIVEKYSEKSGFKEIDWTVDNPEWLDLELGGQGRTIVNSDMNPYTNNLVIKTGLGGENEYLAIARMPEIHAGDSLIKKKHTQMLTGLQHKMQGFKAGTVDEKTVAEHIQMIKNQMQEDITGKTGLIKDLTEIRMNQSFMGKGSGAIMMTRDLEGNSLFGGDMLSVDTRTAALDEVNSASFKNAMFNGKSLNRHYAEGRVVDSLFMSEEAFRGMGYFDKDFMSKTLENLNAEFKEQVTGMSTDEEKMKHLLRTQGDAFISVRYPEIMQGSDKFTMGYLDDTLKGNEMKVVGPTGMSAKLDFDGDMMNAARVTTSDGLSKLHAVTGASVSGELKELQQGIDTNIYTRAITDNAYWESKVQDFMSGKKGYEVMSKAMNLEEIASHKLINGKAYIGTTDNLSEQDLFNLREKYKDVLSDMNDGKFKVDGKRDDSLLVEAINKYSGYDDEEKGIREFVAAKAHQDRQNMITAKIYNNAIGETNVTNQKIKKVISGVLDKSDSDYEYQSNLLFDFLYQAEEAAISSKSSVKGLTSDRAQQWNRSVSALIEGTGNASEHMTNMTDWLNENVRGTLTAEHYYVKSDTFSNKIADNFNVHSLSDFKDFLSNKDNAAKVEDMLISDITSMIEKAAQHEGIGETYKSLRVASSQSGADYRIAQNMNFIKDQETNLRYVSEAMDNAFGNKSVKLLDPELSSPRSNAIFKESIEEIMSSSAQATSKVSTEGIIGDIIEGVGDFAKSASGKKLAMGAVGIAAGIMVSGYVGGRPRPADVHAMEEAQDYQTPMEGYQLADPGMTMSSGQQGYVININARTNKGRQNTIKALEQAIANGSSSNINIAMNITDDYGNINDRKIEEAIMGAF